jgi:hypothetical protein
VLYLLRLLRFKWTYLVVGLVSLGLGLVAYVGARPTHPVEIDGVESSYVEVTKNGNYDRNELKLVGNTTTYTLNKGSFHPTLPDSVWKNGKMQIWVDQDSTAIIAITLYDQQDQNPIKYTTTHYDNPSSAITDAQGGGIFFAVVGVILIGIWGLWFALSRRRAIVQPSTGPPIGMPTPVSSTGVPMPVSSTNVGLSADGKWFWDGGQWRNVSPDGRFRWDGAQWRELGARGPSIGAPPPPTT